MNNLIKTFCRFVNIKNLYKKVLSLTIVLISINIAVANDMPFPPNVISELITIDSFLSNAVVRAKRRYQDNAGNGSMTYQTSSGFENLLESNVENYSQIDRLVLLDDYRIILNLTPNHTIPILKNLKIVLAPSFNQNDLNITKYTCYTDFDKKIRVPFEGSVLPNFNGSLSIFTKFLPPKSTRQVNGCIYIDPDSNANIIYNE